MVPRLDPGRGVLDVDLSSALPGVSGGDAPIEVRCLLRRGQVPVGCADLVVPVGGLTSDELRAALDAPAETVTSRADALELDATAAHDLTVVIATRDRPEQLTLCLDSLAASIAPPARVIVVDNAPCDDRTLELVDARRASDPTLHYVLEPAPGLATAHNAALPHVATGLVAFTDDDVVVDPAWTARLALAFDAAEDVACVTGLIFPAELCSPEQWWIERSAGFAKGFERRVVDPAVARRTDPLFPFNAGAFGSGANMAFRVEDLRRTGGFDDALGAGSGSLGGDDLAAIHAVLASGHRLVYEPAAIVFHHHHRSYEALERQVYGYGAGLTAYLTSVVMRRPTAVLAMAPRAVAGVRHAFAPGSARNARRPETFPELARIERAGMASGPLRYVRARRRSPITGRVDA